MNKTLIVFSLLVLASLSLFVSGAAGSGVQLSSPFTENPPNINGSLGFGEWPAETGNRLDLDNGFVRVVNDKSRLYVLIDLLSDDGDDTEANGSPRDFFYLTFDVDGDGVISAEKDLNYALYPGRENIRYQYYYGPGSWTGLQPETFSSMARGFNCFFADGTRTFGLLPIAGGGIGNLPVIGSCNRHRVWEIAIDLKEIDALPGDTVRMGIRVNSPDPAFSENVPSNFITDFSDLIEVALTPPPLVFYLIGGQIDLEPDPLEVTQAIQTRDNALPLVQDKDTVARVYVDVDHRIGDRFIYPKPALVSLFAQKGGFDLPGSPVTLHHVAPTTIDREDLNDTANFRLPPSWDEETVEFKAVVRGPGSSTLREDSSPMSLTFTPKEEPTFWIVPINAGTNASPVLPTEAEIAAQESYAKVVLPVPDVNFVRRPWQDVGPTSVNSTIDSLNDYYGDVFLAWIFGLLFTGSPPFDLPDQIYGFNTSGGGLSNPEWGSGLGVVARGYIGSSREGTMIHEMTHNLGPGDCADRVNDGMWGRHVSDENKLSALDDPTGQCIGGDAGQNYGCNAAGPDPDWQVLFNSDEIGEVGFDTRLPWSTSGMQRTAVPAEFPDYMSYCQSEDLAGYPANQLPTKWISPFRWERLFNRFNTVSAADFQASSAALIKERLQEVIYVSGDIVFQSGGGLKPIKVFPGIPTSNVNQEGPYSIELRGLKNLLLQRFPFNVSFADPEGNRREIVPFYFQLPFIDGTLSVNLLYRNILIDQIKVSQNMPELRVLSPNGGEIWKERIQKIEWAAQDNDGDLLNFSLFYSHNNGVNWLPLAKTVGQKTRANEGRYALEVDRTSLPGGLPENDGKSALIRILATDGYNTAQDDSDEVFTVLSNAPVVTITSPEEGEWFKPTEKIIFQGTATDTEDESIPDESYLWTYDDGVVFASGPEAEAILPQGYHFITLTVYDSDGMVGSHMIEILVANLCHGDFDTDGDVDGEDMNTMARQIGCKGECLADFDGNQSVNATDLGLFAEDYARGDCPIVEQN